MRQLLVVVFLGLCASFALGQIVAVHKWSHNDTIIPDDFAGVVPYSGGGRTRPNNGNGNGNCHCNDNDNGNGNGRNNNDNQNLTQSAKRQAYVTPGDFYEHINFNIGKPGQMFTFGVNQEWPDMGNSFFNDRISSFKLYNRDGIGMGLTICEHKNFQGVCQTYYAYCSSQSYPDLRNSGPLNDRVSSMRTFIVYCGGESK